MVILESASSQPEHAVSTEPVQQSCSFHVTRHARLVPITTDFMLFFPTQILRRSKLLLLLPSPFCHLAPGAAGQYDGFFHIRACSRIFRI